MTDKKRSIWIGFEPREAAAFAVAKHSIQKHLSEPIPVAGLVLSRLRDAGLYWRTTETRIGQWTDNTGKKWSSTEPVLWDVNSQWTMATAFAISRFLVPHVAQSGWALFMDCDMLVRADLVKLFEHFEAHPEKAVFCVKHHHEPVAGTKMDGQIQSAYPRKNWTSVLAFQVHHGANKELSLHAINTLPGRDLHRLCWLDDDEIGEVGVEWNWLAGHSDPKIEPKIVHHTDGSPCMRAYENAPYADEFRSVLDDWAATC